MTSVSLSSWEKKTDGKREILGRKWIFSPEPFCLTRKESQQILSLGETLFAFQESCEKIYRQSRKEKIPLWISEILDAGKPQWLIDSNLLSSQGIFRLIRPDLLLTEEGFYLTEIDSVPGGLGITAFLMDFFASEGINLGLKETLLSGMESILPEGGEVWISSESQDYRKEMEWLICKMNERKNEKWSCVSAETASLKEVPALYRFFELFDWESIPQIPSILNSLEKGRLSLPLPLQSFWEEKLWFALFWSPGLKKIWKENLRGFHLSRLEKCLPFSWILNEEILPPSAVLPHLNSNSWEEVGEFGRSERNLVLKRSGFHPESWGGKGVFIGNDINKEKWKEKLHLALRESSVHPWIMQKFHSAKIQEHPYYDKKGEIQLLSVRARICPYYFLGLDGKLRLGGAFATLVPIDKKKIHGMDEAILVPCSFEGID